MFALIISVGQTGGRCTTQLAKMSIDPIFVELTADVLKRAFFFFFNPMA